MADAARRLKNLIVKRGFKLKAVADEINVKPYTISRWTKTAPIDKLIGISNFTGIPILEIVDCFRLEHEDTPATEEGNQTIADLQQT